MGGGPTGREVSEMHVNRGMLGWGVFLVALGGVPAAVRGGALDPTVARRAWELWPLLLVGVGLGLALARTRAAVVGGVVVALVLGLMGGGLIAGGIGGIGGSGLAVCGLGTGSAGEGTAGAPASGTFGAAADVRLAADCGTLTVDTAAGSAWTVASTSDGGRRPVIESAPDRLSVQAARPTGLGVGPASASWTVTLPRVPALTLDISVNAGTARASLGGLHLATLDVSVNAGDARLDLGETTGLQEVNASANFGTLAVTFPRTDGVLSGTLSANAGALRICVPQGVPLVIRAGDHALASNNFVDRGLVRSGDTWTGGDAAASGRLELHLDANLGSITLDPENGCG